MSKITSLIDTAMVKQGNDYEVETEFPGGFIIRVSVGEETIGVWIAKGHCRPAEGPSTDPQLEAMRKAAKAMHDKFFPELSYCPAEDIEGVMRQLKSMAEEVMHTRKSEPKKTDKQIVTEAAMAVIVASGSVSTSVEDILNDLYDAAMLIR